MGLTTLEALAANRGRKQILGQLDPWEDPNFTSAVRGLRTQGQEGLRISGRLLAKQMSPVPLQEPFLQDQVRLRAGMPSIS